jgi:hypothetical protein
MRIPIPESPDGELADERTDYVPESCLQAYPERDDTGMSCVRSPHETQVGKVKEGRGYPPFVHVWGELV